VLAFSLASSAAAMAWSGARVKSRSARRHRVSVIGLGAMGRRHVRVFAGLASRFELVGGYDVRPQADAPASLRRFQSEADAIARAEVVVVATPNATHRGIVTAALLAGRDVLVEKPICATSADVGPVLAAAEAGGARLFVGHSERFNPVVRAMVRLVRGDALLAIDLRRLAMTTAASQVGALINLGVHDFDLAAYLAGGPLTLHRAVGRGRAPGGEASEDAAHVVFTTAGGCVGHIHVDRAAATKERRLTLVTPRWRYEGDLLTHRLVRAPHAGARAATATAAPRDEPPGQPATEVPLVLEEPLVAQALALADALDGAPAREIATAHDGASALLLADQAASMCRAAGGESRPVQRVTPG
jgi:predicted dehydrogenase